MSGTVNKATVVGNVGCNPEVRTSPFGNKVAVFSVATADKWTDKQTGEKKERTEWHRIVVLNEHLVSIVEQYVRKGSKVYLDGKIQTRKWTDNSGTERYTTEIVISAYHGDIQLMSSRQSNLPPPAESPDDYGNTRVVSNTSPSDDPSFPGDINDEIPF